MAGRGASSVLHWLDYGARCGDIENGVTLWFETEGGVFLASRADLLRMAAGLLPANAEGPLTLTRGQEAHDRGFGISQEPPPVYDVGLAMKNRAWGEVDAWRAVADRLLAQLIVAAESVDEAREEGLAAAEERAASRAFEAHVNAVMDDTNLTRLQAHDAVSTGPERDRLVAARDRHERAKRANQVVA